MRRYRVYVSTVVECAVVVEAEDAEQAEDLAVAEVNFPYLPGWDCSDHYEPYGAVEVTDDVA